MLLQVDVTTEAGADDGTPGVVYIDQLRDGLVVVETGEFYADHPHGRAERWSHHPVIVDGW